MSISKIPADRRAFGRRHVQDRGVVRVAGRPPVHCIILNISNGGAMLDIGAPLWLPFNFHLSWDGSSREELCELRHQNGGRIGVRFLAAASRTTAKDQALSVHDVAPWISNPRSPRRPA